MLELVRICVKRSAGRACLPGSRGQWNRLGLGLKGRGREDGTVGLCAGKGWLAELHVESDGALKITRCAIVDNSKERVLLGPMAVWEKGECKQNRENLSEV
jgi:hypothetical protein